MWYFSTCHSLAKRSFTFKIWNRNDDMYLIAFSISKISAYLLHLPLVRRLITDMNTLTFIRVHISFRNEIRYKPEYIPVRASIFPSRLRHWLFQKTMKSFNYIIMRLAERSFVVLSEPLKYVSPFEQIFAALILSYRLYMI